MLAMVNNTSVSIGMHDLFKLVILFSLEKYPRVKLLNHLGCVCVCELSCVQLFVIHQAGVHQAPLSTASPGKNTGVGCHFLFQGIFPTQNLTCVSCISCIGRWILYHWSHLGSLGSSDSSSKKFLRKCHTVSPQGLHHFTSPSTIHKCLFFPHPYRHLLFVVFLIIAALTAVR